MVFLEGGQFLQAGLGSRVEGPLAGVQQVRDKNRCQDADDRDDDQQLDEGETPGFTIAHGRTFLGLPIKYEVLSVARESSHAARWLRSRFRIDGRFLQKSYIFHIWLLRWVFRGGSLFGGRAGSGLRRGREARQRGPQFIDGRLLGEPVAADEAVKGMRERGDEEPIDFFLYRDLVHARV